MASRDTKYIEEEKGKQNIEQHFGWGKQYKQKDRTL